MDKLIKALALNNAVRVYVINNTDTVNTAIKKHSLWPSATSVLSKALTMGQIMGCMLKGDEGLTIKITGNGQIGQVIVDAKSNGEVRGYVQNPEVNFVNNSGGLNDYYAIGNKGTIEVVKDLRMKTPFTSSIDLTGNLAQDFTYYFFESEQTKSLCSLGVLVNTKNMCDISGGILVQLLPNATEETIDYLEERMKLITNFNKVLKNHSLEGILRLLFKKDYEILDTVNVMFKCNCSKDSFSRSLLTLGSKELEQILTQDEKIETRCYYCNNKYEFSKDEIKDLIAELKKQNR
ncbi:MAG: Hsp33 family molecular chaperone HslO [Bacilli bacterium]